MPSSLCLGRVALRADSCSMAPRSLIHPAHVSFFSTSAVRSANPNMKKKNAVVAPKRGERMTYSRNKGKADVRDPGKRPAPGERKALKKRIVLSNTNALAVPTLQDLTKENVLSNEIEGQVMGIPALTLDALRAVEAFKPTQGWSLFRRPACLMRRETMEIIDLVKQVEAGKDPASKQTIRRVIVGDRSSGKTTLVLQALMVASLRDWVIINLPDGKDIAIGHTEYAPIPATQPVKYQQDAYVANLLVQIVKANAKILSEIQVSSKPALPIPTPAKLTIKTLAQLGIDNPEASWPVFCAVWKELTQPGRPPIMFALDNLSHVMRNSGYFAPDMKPIHAHDLAIVEHFVNYLSGNLSLPNGGIVLAATTGSNSPACPSLDFALFAAEARQVSLDNLPQWNPYKAVDERVIESLKTVQVLRSNGISKPEARSIMEYYAASGMLRAKVDAPFVSERWTLAGSGNMGELEKATVRLRV